MRRATTLLAIAAILCTITLVSCKKEENPSKISRKVIYKAYGSPGTNISVAVVSTDGVGGMETTSSLIGDTWTSKEYTFPTSIGMAVAAVNAKGPLETSTLRLEIWVDGEKKIEGNSSGEVLTSNASFNLQ